MADGALLFDLDGTLVDTAPDMARALNHLLREHHRPALPFAHIRSQVSHGALALIQLGFGISAEHREFGTLRQRFLQIYAAGLCRETRLFRGMRAVLDHCRQRHLPWGIVTNKPAFLTEPLVKQLGLWDEAACVVSGDTLSRRKPHPQPLLHGCRLTGSSPHRCIYVGDAARDIEAGKRAGMTTLVATFGYLDSADRPISWGADGLVSEPAELIQWLDGRA